eukprot:3202650-Amphidinium_carterae.1
MQLDSKSKHQRATVLDLVVLLKSGPNCIAGHQKACLAQREVRRMRVEPCYQVRLGLRLSDRPLQREGGEIVMNLSHRCLNTVLTEAQLTLLFSNAVAAEESLQGREEPGRCKAAQAEGTD